jgi:Tfp pilus assembly protein PilN
MNKINPLYLFAFLVLVVLFMVYQNSRMQSKIVLTAQKNIQLERTGKHIKTLKEQWKNPKKAQKRIDAILSQHIFKTKIVKKERKKEVYKIELKELTAAQLDSLVNKFLNEPLSVRKIKMTRNDDKNVSVYMEFIL